MNQHLKTVCSYDLLPAQTLCQVLKQIQHLVFISEKKPGLCGLSHKPLARYKGHSCWECLSHYKITQSPGTNLGQRWDVFNLISYLSNKLHQASFTFYLLPTKLP